MGHADHSQIQESINNTMRRLANLDRFMETKEYVDYIITNEIKNHEEAEWQNVILCVIKKNLVKNHLDLLPEIAEKLKDMNVTAYLNYFQCQDTKDADSTANLYELQKNTIVPGQAYLNYSQSMKTIDSELITWYQRLQETMDTRPAAPN